MAQTARKEDDIVLQENGRLFSRKDLAMLLIPLIVEQLFTALMGTADTMMVARVGDAAVSGVSLVDSINNLVLMMIGRGPIDLLGRCCCRLRWFRCCAAWFAWYCGIRFYIWYLAAWKRM